MPDKPLLVFNDTLLSSTSVGTTFSSPSYNVSEVTMICIQAVWTGTSPLGATSLEASLDDTNYTPITGSSLAVSGNTGSNMYNIEHPAYKFIRLTYTATSGTGTISAKISGKFD